MEYYSLHFLRCTNLGLPNLRVLRFDHPSGPFHPIVVLWPLLTPNIITLEVTLASTSDPKFQSFLDFLPSLCRHLKSIKFDFCDFLSHGRLPLAAAQSLSRVICSRADWQRFELSCPIDSITLKHLGMCSTLKVFSVTLAPETTRPDEIYFGDAETPFRNVTKLDLTLWDGLDLAIVMQFLRAHDQAFHSFRVALSLNTQTTAMGVSALLRAVASPGRIHSLQSVIVRRPRDTHRGVFVPASMIQGLSYEMFRPIASLVHLHELVIDLNHPISIDDDEFAGLVCNWPCLEVLWMTGTREEHPAKSITLKGFSSLLVSCPRLREIGMSLDARRVPSDVYVDVSRSLVSLLTFQNSPIENPELVEEFLFQHLSCLPHVQVVFTQNQTSGDIDQKYERLWGRVNVCRYRRLESE